jgi:flagellar assembly protein FliH
MNMLSKIHRGEKVKELALETFNIPDSQEIGLMVEEKRRKAQRKRMSENHNDDPLRAAKQEANRILNDARKKLNEAAAEANLLKIQQEKELRTQLEKEYQVKLEQQVSQIQQNYFNSLEELTTLKQLIYNQLENQLMDLVLSISRKVIDTEIKTSPEIILGMLEKGFARIKETKEYEIKINPGDYDTIIGKKDKANEILKNPGHIKFKKDENIEQGGCRIITPQGELPSESGKQ